ncbi:hypothetical protein [Leptothrix discophora]|uniref:Transcriptional regulator n=1 Tax=Leptothrix discophora TaxID=89 RepID=A0ABT9G6R0_LEPDI|nr:hypothetical protein [Leptothrix discophora]MDP4302167.1 hypothetical protein [Leptothrix discophora]
MSSVLSAQNPARLHAQPAPAPVRPVDMPAGESGAASHPSARRGQRNASVLLTLGALLGATWAISQRGWFQAGDDIGYWLGVVGGSMMLLLLLYPLRKHVRAMRGWGSPKVWLAGHMVLGIGGPLLILLHCGFQVGSLNAAAALYSMCIVAASGVIGRFLYVRVNRGLVAERNALGDLRRQMGFDGERRSMLWFAPQVQQDLDAFEADVVARSKSPSGAGRHWLRLLLVLPLRSWSVRLKAQREIRVALRVLAREQNWQGSLLRQRQRQARRSLVSYFVAVMRVALFAAWERLFALWHVAHIPFVFLLVIAGVVHVVAVHAY